VAFILNGAKFVSELRKSKHLIIEAEVFQRGDQQMHWDLPDFPLKGGEPVKTKTNARKPAAEKVVDTEEAN
jgi:hypothetical protein